MLEFDDGLVEKRIIGLSQEEADKPRGSGNPVTWLLGHLLNTRIHLVELTGGKVKFDASEVFRTGFDSGKKYPTLKEMGAVWKTAARELATRLENIDEQKLAEPLSYEIPNKENTVAGALAFFTYHEAWHLGQISAIRKSIENEGLVPY